MKKTEKARNLKVLKIQIQQVDTYAEKIQVLLEILVLVKTSLVELMWPVPSRSEEMQNVLWASLLFRFISFPVPVTDRHFSLFCSFYSFICFSEMILSQFLSSLCSLFLTSIIFLFNLLFFLPLFLHIVCDLVFPLLKKKTKQNKYAIKINKSTIKATYIPSCIQLLSCLSHFIT